MGLGLCHIETLDEQPLGPVHQADLLHALFHRLLLGLQLAQPLPQGAQYPQGVGNHGQGGGLGQGEHAVGSDLGVHVVVESALHTQQNSGVAGAAHVDGQAHTEVILEGGVDEDDIIFLVQQCPASLAAAGYHVDGPEIIAGEQVGDGAVKGG